MTNRKDYKLNKGKELQSQKIISDVLEGYFKDNGYEVTKQEITNDRKLQSKGIDRIVHITDNTNNYCVYVDDKVQGSTALISKGAKYDYLFIPYLRKYTDDYKTYDGAMSDKKETDIVVMVTADNIAVLGNCNELKVTLHNNYEYFTNKYGYDKQKQEYYKLYNKLEATDTMPGYEYEVYLMKMTMLDITTDPLIKQCILSIFNIEERKKEM